MSEQADRGAPGDDRGFVDITSTLERAGVTYWVDSGVLLGLRREGRMLTWDKDIDLAILADDEKDLRSTVDDLRDLGYDVVENRYHGRLWSIALTPTAVRDPEDVRAAIHVYHRTADHLWSPQPQIYVPPPAPDVLPGRRSLVGRLLRRLLDRLVYSPSTAGTGRVSRAPDRTGVTARLGRRFYRSIDRGRLAETWPISEVFVPFTWVVPANLVLPLGTLTVPGGTFPVPGDVDGYLSHRYGDWQTPVTDWCYWVDDGSLVPARPAAVLAQLRRGADPHAVGR